MELHPRTVGTGLSKEALGSVRKEKLFKGEWVAERLVQVVKETGVEGKGGAGTGRVRRCHREREQEKEWGQVGGMGVFLLSLGNRKCS